MAGPLISVSALCDVAAIPDKKCPGNAVRFNAHMKVERSLAAVHCTNGKVLTTTIQSTSYDPLSVDSNQAVALVTPLLSFKAHLDSIVTCFCVDNPPGLVTVSNDGYLRVWSSEGQVLGEIALPNIDQGRKAER